MAISVELLNMAKAGIFSRTRLDKINDIVDRFTDAELEAALLDSLDEINSFEPSSSYSVEGVFGGDARVRSLLLLGAAKNLVSLLVFDYTANGIDIDLGDGVSLQSRLSDYQSLLGTIAEEFNRKLENIKKADGKRYSVKFFSTKGAGGHTALSRRLSVYRPASRA